MKNIFKKISTRIKKEKLSKKESLDSKNLFNPARKVTVNNNPFRYCVIENLFTEKVYEHICKDVQSIKDRGLSNSPSTDMFRPFKYVTGYLEKYGGYFYSPKFGESKYLDIFFSVNWNLFIENLIETYTNFFVSTTIHYHDHENKNGWAHNDYQKVYFNKENILSNGMIYQKDTKGSLSEATMRAIAVIYYFDNDDWSPGDGGETALYKDPSLSEVVKIAPLSNSMLAFEISPASYHAFLGNKKPRNAIVQWFHGDIEDFYTEYGHV